MNAKPAEKTPKVTAKSFMTVGPTLHYSHKNVQRCWLLALVVFAAGACFWSRVVTGSFWSFDIQALTSSRLWRLDQSIVTGVSIFEYPWQILVLGLLMGVLAIVPVLTSQLMSFSYSLPFILVVAFLADLPAFAGCLLLSCFAAACRPLRFRSRFTAIALCTAPQLLYWGFFGGARGVEPVKWAFSFAPWICAWLIGLSIGGLVLGIGHFTRYRPGLVWIFTAVFIFLAGLTFEIRIRFDELDYQLYVAKNNPEQVEQFRDRSIADALNATLTNPVVMNYLAGPFYPAEPIPLRAALKKEIEAQLLHGRWPSWFMVPTEFKYHEKRQWLLEQYDLFISRRPKSSRMPIALYYKALLSEYSPDLNLLEQKEVLHFYSDYPFERTREIWWYLYTHKEFGKSPESIEACWRIAKHLAGQGKFEQADRLLAEAQNLATERTLLLEKQQARPETFFGIFRPPADSVMTPVKVAEMQIRLNQLRTLIGPQNRTDQTGSPERLATFVRLNPHTSDYPQHLDELLRKMPDKDGLRDNVMLAQIKLIGDDQLKAERLAQLHKQFQDTDGGMQALYALARLRISTYQNETNAEKKRKYLADARAILTTFLSLYPESYCADQVQKNLADLPTAD